MSDDIFYRVISEDDKGHNQIRLTVNQFRDIEYLHLRRYYLDFDGEWYPSGDGICLPIDIESVKELFIGVAEIISLAETREVVEEYFGDIIRSIYK